MSYKTLPKQASRETRLLLFFYFQLTRNLLATYDLTSSQITTIFAPKFNIERNNTNTKQL